MTPRFQFEVVEVSSEEIGKCRTSRVFQLSAVSTKKAALGLFRAAWFWVSGVVGLEGWCFEEVPGGFVGGV